MCGTNKLASVHLFYFHSLVLQKVVDHKCSYKVEQYVLNDFTWNHGICFICRDTSFTQDLHKCFNSFGSTHELMFKMLRKPHLRSRCLACGSFACVPNWSAWVPFPVPVPSSSFLLMHILGSSCESLDSWVPAKPLGDLDSSQIRPDQSCHACIWAENQLLEKPSPQILLWVCMLEDNKRKKWTWEKWWKKKTNLRTKKWTLLTGQPLFPRSAHSLVGQSLFL